MSSKRFYNGISNIYDLMDVIYFKNAERSPRKAVCDYLEPGDIKILDVCTGTAANSIVIARKRRDVRITGIDISEEMLSIARKKVLELRLSNINLLRMDATKTGLSDKSFDVILISLVLHELPEALAKDILLEAKRILKPDGKVLVVEWEQPNSIRKRPIFYLTKKLEPKGFDRFLNQDMEKYFHRYGFEIKDVKHCDYTKVIMLKKHLE